MEKELKTETEAEEYFKRAAKKCTPRSVVLNHNQRKTVLRILKEAAEESGKKFIQKDLSVVEEERIGSTIFKDEIPVWLKDVFKDKESGYVVYLREFHYASDRIKDDAMNIILNMEVEGEKFPPNTFIVLGVMDMDDMTEALSRVHIVKFFRT
ncbi:MAG: hypothetical protein ACLFP1_06840 [Candidatus Goldiibacteriota bacterium]